MASGLTPALRNRLKDRTKDILKDSGILIAVWISHLEEIHIFPIAEVPKEYRDNIKWVLYPTPKVRAGNNTGCDNFPDF